MSTCNGKWGKCPNAYRTLTGGKHWTAALPTMRCKLTGQHPDDCRKPVVCAEVEAL